jgi:sodium-dependent dicarboxylate transporter 2/3/5
VRKELLKAAGLAGALLAFLLASGAGLDHKQCITLAVVSLMALWWFTEAVELYITALVPVVVFPLVGIMPLDDVAPLYMKEIIFLFIGGFLFAFAMEKWNLHRRIALKILMYTRGSPQLMLLGFMLSSYLLSMWILNTATVTMLLPAVLAVTADLVSNQSQATSSSPATPHLLGLTFASSIGGMATIIGTAPNIVFLEANNTAPANTYQLTFANWAMMALPLSLVLFAGTFVLLTVLFRKTLNSARPDIGKIRESYRQLGPVKTEERVLLFLLVTQVALWVFMNDINFGSFTMPGWGNAFSYTTADGSTEPFLTESSVAISVAFLLFLIPSGGKGDYMITWSDAKRIPIGVIFLFGAGFALGKAVEVSGLAGEMSSALQGLSHVHPIVLVVLACVMITVISELASNLATIMLFIPVLFAVQPYVDCHPMQLYMPTALAASCGFMLPIATPPNTIVFATEQIKMRDMVRAGFWLDLFAIVTLGVLGYVFVGWVV